MNIDVSKKSIYQCK